MKSNFTLAFVLCLFCCSAMAENIKGKLTGSVIDGNKKALPFTTVMLLKAQDSSLVKGEVSDETGKFIIEGIAEGSYIVSTSLVGYKKYYSKQITISSENSSINLPPIILGVETQQLGEVTVVGQKPLIEQKIDKMVMNVENSIVATGGNALEVLQRAPGVMVDKDDRISLRGKQGVVIMIDGKPTNLSAEDAANMLRNMPSNSIEQVELITNPSSKYDAAGNAGIINIKLKKNSKIGMNGSITAGVGYGKFEKFNGGTTLNYKNKAWNFFGNYNYSYNHRYNSNQLLRKIGSGDELINFNQYNYRPMTFQNHSYKVGVDYSINKNHTVGFATNGFVTYGGLDVSNNTLIQNADYETDSSLRMTNNIDNRWSSMAYNLNYRATLDTAGRELSADVDYSKYNGQGNDDLQAHYYNRQGMEVNFPLILRSDIPSEVEIKSAKVDYVHPFTKDIKVETGLKTSFVKTDNNVKWDTYNEGQWSVDEGRTNHFVYEENLNAAYLNVSGKYKAFGVQLGLRAEQTNAEGNLINKNINKPDTSYINFFPTVFVTQKITEKHQLGYSYSKRIDRPSYQDLNPFIYFLDTYAYFQGNPFLKPQYTHSFQLSHTFDGKIITTLGYSNTKNVITQVTEQNDETKVTRATMTNLDTYNNYSLGINAPIPITKWWSSNNNLNFYYKDYRSFYLGSQLKNNSYSWTLNSNHTITLPKDFSAEINGMYLSPNVEGIIRIRSMYVLNMGIQKNFLNKKANLKLNVNDVFNMMKFRGDIKYQNMDLKIRGQWESRQARLTFTYRFGQEDMKAQRRRSSGAQDEQNRVKMGGE